MCVLKRGAACPYSYHNRTQKTCMTLTPLCQQLLHPPPSPDCSLTHTHTHTHTLFTPSALPLLIHLSFPCTQTHYLFHFLSLTHYLCLSHSLALTSWLVAMELCRGRCMYELHVSLQRPCFCMSRSITGFIDRTSSQLTPHTLTTSVQHMYTNSSVSSIHLLKS